MDEQHPGPSRRPTDSSTLLIVDDDPLVARSIARVLRPRFAAVQIVASVAEALRATAAAPGWAAVIADQHLGDGLGVDLLLELRREQPEVPVALLTGELSAELANLCAEHRILYLVKPVDVRVLERLFRRDAIVVLSSDVEALSAEIGASPREAVVIQLTARQRLTQRQAAVLVPEFLNAS